MVLDVGVIVYGSSAVMKRNGYPSQWKQAAPIIVAPELASPMHPLEHFDNIMLSCISNGYVKHRKA